MNSQFESLQSESESIAEKIDQMSYSVSRLLTESSFDENSVLESEQRLSSYQDMFRKFSVTTIEELLVETDSLKHSLDILENYQDELISLINSLALCPTLP